ncbi:hypothetical protein ACQR1W_09060 [Bradyrhizobium sp. HKCCYLS1011]|uniref:hypothetical protein n=1 Tax=Bradyrhizobium sp. HKCCYLS1011 TaxID=3420733 RepID=UPI003EB9785F
MDILIRASSLCDLAVAPRSPDPSFAMLGWRLHYITVFALNLPLQLVFGSRRSGNASNLDVGVFDVQLSAGAGQTICVVS